MRCSRCGSQLKDMDRICPHCGNTVEQHRNIREQPERRVQSRNQQPERRGQNRGQQSARSEIPRNNSAGKVRSPHKQQSVPWLPVLLSVLSVAVICGSGIFLFMNKGRVKSSIQNLSKRGIMSAIQNSGDEDTENSQGDSLAEEPAEDSELINLDVIVSDLQEQFLTDASVTVYEKTTDSAADAPTLSPELTTSENGQSVYRFRIKPGTYCISVTQAGTTLASEEEVKAANDTTVTYIQNNMEEQVRLLAGLCRSLCSGDPFEYAMYIQCWVSDYDQNGQLELNFSNTDGSGSFTVWRCYEVNKAIDAVDAVEWDYDTYMPDGFTDLQAGDTDYSQPQTGPGYYDEASGIWYYIMYDYVRAGWAENGTTYYTMAKKGNTLELTELGWLVNENSQDGSTSTTYTVDENVCGTEDSFYETMRTKLADRKEVSYTVLKFDEMESTDLYTDLWNSADTFQVTG